MKECSNCHKTMADDAVVCIHCGYHHELKKVLALATSAEAEKEESNAPESATMSTLSAWEQRIALAIASFYGTSRWRAYATVLLFVCVLVALVRENRRLSRLTAARPPDITWEQAGANDASPDREPSEQPVPPVPDEAMAGVKNSADAAAENAPADVIDEFGTDSPAPPVKGAGADPEADRPDEPTEPVLDPEVRAQAGRLLRLALVLDPANADAQLCYGQFIRERPTTVAVVPKSDGSALADTLVSLARRSLERGGEGDRILASACFASVILDIDPANRDALMAVGSEDVVAAPDAEVLDKTLTALRLSPAGPQPRESGSDSRLTPKPVGRSPEVDYLAPSDGCCWPATHSPEFRDHDPGWVLNLVRKRVPVDVWLGADPWYGKGDDPHFDVRHVRLDANGSAEWETSAGDRYRITVTHAGSELVLQQLKGETNRRVSYRINPQIRGRYDRVYRQNTKQNISDAGGFVVVVPASE